MRPNNIHPPRGLLIAIAVLLVVAVIAAPLFTALIPPEELPKFILVLGLPFLASFVAFILGFIYLIYVLAARFNGRISRRAFSIIENIIIALIALCVIGMFQPISMLGFQLGFPTLILATFSFIAWSHITPRGTRPHEDIGPVSISEEVVTPDTTSNDVAPQGGLYS